MNVNGTHSPAAHLLRWTLCRGECCPCSPDLLCWTGLGTFLPPCPHAPATKPEISSAFCCLHIPLERKSVRSLRRMIIFEE